MRNDVLVGIVNFTRAKDYCREKFVEMMEACVEPIVGWDNILVVSDEKDPVWKTCVLPVPGPYAEDMLMVGREVFRLHAIENDYQKMVWQGVDAFWESKHDFERMVSRPVDIVAPLITSRQDSNYAICRRFVNLTDEQEDVPDEQLDKGWLICTGFPGADNIIIDRCVYEVPFLEGHKPWYQRVAEGLPNLCVEENWILTAQRMGFQAWCDTAFKAWHVHEDGVARMYKGIDKPLAELSW